MAPANAFPNSFLSKRFHDTARHASAPAAAPAVYATDGDVLAVGDEITIDVDQIGTAAAKGLRVYLVGQRAN